MSDNPRHEAPASEARLSTRLAALTGALYLLLAIGAGIINPLFEAPDEHWHYFTAQYIADTLSLPRVEIPPDPWLGQEAAQPPLYYMMGAVLIAPLDTEGARDIAWPNPHVVMGDASALNNRNAFVHGPWEDWPWRGYVLAAHVLRMFSSVLGLGTLLAIYGTARCLWPTRPYRALLAMAMPALLPQFVFIHSAVTNDALITFLSSVAIWQLVRLWRGPLTPRALTLLGVTIGLAILSKTAGLLLLGFATGVLILRAIVSRASLGRGLLHVLLFVAGPALALGGWLLVRNITLYGDPTAANQFVAIAGGDRGYTLAQVLSESSGLWTSFFAMFGWFNVRAPGWLYVIWYVVVAAGLAGAAGALWKGRSRWVLTEWRAHDRTLVALWLAFWFLLVYAGLVAFMLRTPAAQGRLLFPAIAPLALGLAYGLDGLGRARAVWPALALLTTLFSLLFVIPKTYAAPQTLASDELPRDMMAQAVEMDGGLTLLGYKIESPRLQPGGTLRATLFWRKSSPPQPLTQRADAPQLVVELFGRDEALVGKFQGYHAGGHYPATLWPQDVVIAEPLTIPLTTTMTAPTEVRIQAGLVSSQHRQTVARVEVEPHEWPDVPGEAQAHLEGDIDLVGATLSTQEIVAGEPFAVVLAWRVTEDVGASLTTFVHMGPLGETPLAQGDGVPLHGYYPTSRWQAGEVIVNDEYMVPTSTTVATGRYPIVVGLYDPDSGERIPLYVDGERQETDAYVVGWVEITAAE